MVRNLTSNITRQRVKLERLSKKILFVYIILENVFYIEKRQTHEQMNATDKTV